MALGCCELGAHRAGVGGQGLPVTLSPWPLGPVPQSVWVKTGTLQWWCDWKPHKWVDVRVALEQFTGHDGARDSILFIYYVLHEEKKVRCSGWGSPGWGAQGRACPRRGHGADQPEVLGHGSSGDRKVLAYMTESPWVTGRWGPHRAISWVRAAEGLARFRREPGSGDKAAHLPRVSLRCPCRLKSLDFRTGPSRAHC